MNGKKARKLRKLAVEIAQAVAQETNRHVLSTDPVKVYKELKNIDKQMSGKI